MSDTPVPTDYRPIWSHSALASFETCPRKFWAERIAKTSVQEVHPSTQWGTDVHLALENRGKHNTPLPQNMVQYQNYADKITAMARLASRTEYEYKMGVRIGGEPCRFEDSQAWGRSIADVILIYDDKQTLVVIDHKTGKYKGKTDQPLINAYMAFAHFPNIEVIHTLFSYIKEDVMDKESYYRSSIEDEILPVKNKVMAYRLAVQHQNFPAKQSGLCRQWCGDHSCPFNGKYKRAGYR